MSEDSDNLRELLKRLGLGQREAARYLEVDEREFRRMCAGTREVPRVIVLALENLIEVKKLIEEANR